MNGKNLTLSKLEINKLRKSIVQHVDNFHDAEDILQETLLSLWEQGRKQTISQPFAYAVRIAKHAVYRLYRANQYYCPLGVDSDNDTQTQTLDDSFMQQQHISRISEQLQQMSTLRRDILLKRWTTNKARACIAKELNISEESVKKHLYRGTKQLQQLSLEA